MKIKKGVKKLDDSENCCRVDVNESLIENAKNDILIKKEFFDNQVKVFSLLGNDVRLKIVYLLLENEKMCVCDLSDILQMKQSATSQHLRKLKDGGILGNKRDGLTIFYSVLPSMKQKIKALIKE